MEEVKQGYHPVVDSASAALSVVAVVGIMSGGVTPDVAGVMAAAALLGMFMEGVLE